MVDTVTNGTGAAGVGAANSKLECVVEYDYDAQLGDELTIRVGDVITDIDMMEGGWWKGNLRGKIGMFPDNFVKLLPSPPKGSAENGDATAKKCHVLFSYSPAHDDELSLDVGDVVEYMGDVEEGWYKGRLNGRVGVFPSNFVEICNTNCDNNKNNSHHRPQNIVETSMNQDSKQMFSDTTTKNQYNGESNKQSGARNKSLNGGGDVANISPDVTLNSAKYDGGNSPSSPNSRGPGVAGMMTTSERMLRNTDPAPGAAPRLPPKPVKDQCVVLFPYTAQNQDELTLVEGEIITIVSRVIEDAGWWRGELDGKVGVFPDNFVKVISSECGESTPNSSAGGTPTSSVINSKVNSLVSGSNKQLFDKKTSSSRDNITDHVSSVLSEADKKKDSPDKLNSSSPLSSSGGSRLSRTSSERGSGSSSQTSARMQSMGLNNKQVSASGSNDSFKSQSNSNVSEKKALFSGRSGSSANLKENEIRSNEPRYDSRIKNNFKNDDRIIKKPVVPEALTKTLSSNNSQEAGENTKPRPTEIENGTVVLRNPPTTTTGLDQVNREQTLSNLTASRVKAPKRRPPSNVFLKENIPDELDNEVENETNNDDSQHKQSKEESFKKSSDNIEKQFNPLKMGISVLPGKESLRSTGTFDNTTKNREETANQEKSKVEANPVKNMWLEELSRKQANRRSMTALNDRKQEHLGIPAKTESSLIPSGSKPAIPSKPLDTRKSLSSIIRRPNSFGEKTAANTTSSTSAINQSGSGKVEAKLGETKSSAALFAAKTNSSSSDGAKNSTGNSRQDLTRKISGGGERNRKDSLSKESSFEHRSLSPKRSLGDDRSSLLSSSKIKDSSPRSGSKESGKEQTQRISNKENKDVNHHRSSSKESERSRRSTASELIRKASDSMNKLNTDNSKPAVHSNNLGKPGSWSFAERPERPTDLSKLDFLNRSPKLDSSSSKGDLSRLESSQKSTSNNNISASLDTHEEAGFVVVEATNEILKSTAASLWASEDGGGEQPRPPAREKNQSGGIGTQLSSAAKSQEPAGIVKALEKRVEELERLIMRVETNYKSDVASLTGQLESERQRRVHLEQEISKLNRIVTNK